MSHRLAGHLEETMLMLRQLLQPLLRPEVPLLMMVVALLLSLLLLQTVLEMEPLLRQRMTRLLRLPLQLLQHLRLRMTLPRLRQPPLLHRLHRLHRPRRQ